MTWWATILVWFFACLLVAATVTAFYGVVTTLIQFFDDIHAIAEWHRIDMESDVEEDS